MALSKPIHLDIEYVEPGMTGEDRDTIMHVHKLSLFCRLCNQPKAITSYLKPYVAKHCHDEIKQMWDLCIMDDNDKVHPPYICQACHKKITR